MTFTHKIDVNDGEKKGNVEIWLREIEVEMRTTLKKISQQSLEDRAARSDWVIKYQAMIVLMGNMIRWSGQTEDALKNTVADDKAVKKLLAILTEELSGIVVKVRGDLSELDRSTLGALVVLDVHNKDVIESFVTDNINSPLEFAWLSQLRYYANLKRGQFQVDVKCINAVQQYGFEYLGNSTR